jgi:uncharacterized protein (TIGR01777 family)
LTNSVLITGASGLIGQRLTELLLQKGCRVSHLGRSIRRGKIPSFVWDPDAGTIDNNAFNGIDTVIHLAGAGIADKRWSHARKKEILDSRLRSTALLVKSLKATHSSVKTVIAASAIGYYGFGNSDTVLNEESLPGSDFLSSVVVKWEQETDRIDSPGIRLVKIRIGIVLSERGGALKEIVRPVRWGVGASLGTGKQLVSWIHLDDLCEMFMMAIQQEQIAGVYNATAPNPVTNQNLTESIASVLGRRILLPNVPSFALHLLIGEMADLVLFGSWVSSKKIEQKGFKFRFPVLNGALRNLLEPTSSKESVR